MYREFSSSPAEFKSSLLDIAKKEAKDGTGKIAIGTLGVIWAAGFFGWGAFALGSIQGSLMGVFGLLVAFFLGAIAMDGWTKVRRAREARSQLMNVR